MNDKTLTLKALMRTLTEAAAYANNMLRRDCAAEARGGGNAKLIMPPPRPLCLAGMRVSFTANVTDDECSSYQKNGGDISLDFGSPNGNFKGEIVFKPCGPEPDAVCECGDCDDDDGGEVTGIAAEECEAESYSDGREDALNEPADASAETPFIDNFENSGIY